MSGEENFVWLVEEENKFLSTDEQTATDRVSAQAVVGQTYGSHNYRKNTNHFEIDSATASKYGEQLYKKLSMKHMGGG